MAGKESVYPFGCPSYPNCRKSAVLNGGDVRTANLCGLLRQEIFTHANLARGQQWLAREFAPKSSLFCQGFPPVQDSADPAEQSQVSFRDRY